MTYLYQQIVSKAYKLLFSLSILLLVSQVSFSQLVFKNPVLISGTALKMNSVYQFNNVAPGVNAIVKVDSLVNGSKILTIDESGTGYDRGFQPKIKSGGNGTSYVLFTISFVNSATGTPFSFPAVSSTILDIDGNSKIKEFAEVTANSGLSSLFSATPQITLQNNGNKSTGKNTAGIEVTGIDTSAKDVMFNVSAPSISTLNIKFGTISTSNHDDDDDNDDNGDDDSDDDDENGTESSRQYSAYFPSISQAASTLPVTLTNFQANLKDKSASLVWTTTNQINFSHFVIEKSTDGKNFQEAAILFAEENTTATTDYKYKDNLQNSSSKVVFYRLKMVDANAKYTYSDTRMVRLATEGNTVQISTFPNPVTNEVRIMVPAEWQEKAVTYEIYSSTGVLVQRVQNQKAAQVQQVNVQHLNSGNYIVKVSNGLAVSTSKIIKVN